MAYETPSNASGVSTATQVVVGLFKNANDARQAVTQLRAQRVSAPGQIGAAFRGPGRDIVSRSGRCRRRLFPHGSPRAGELVGQGERCFPWRG